MGADEASTNRQHVAIFVRQNVTMEHPINRLARASVFAVYQATP